MNSPTANNGSAIRIKNSPTGTYFYAKNGAAGRDRTCDLLVTNELLYLLSYSGTRDILAYSVIFFHLIDGTVEGTPDLTQYKTTDITRDVTYYGNGCPDNSDTNNHPCSSCLANTYLNVELQKNGTYYSGQAATVGTGSSITDIEADVPDTFCPLGWHLPYSGTDGDYYDKSKSWLYLFLRYNYLNDQSGSIGISTYPLDYVRSGILNLEKGYLAYLNSVGQYWSSVIHGGYHGVYRLNYWIGNYYEAQMVYMATGEAIRCV